MKKRNNSSIHQMIRFFLLMVFFLVLACDPNNIIVSGDATDPPTTPAPPEIGCDGIDNNENGQIDEDEIVMFSNEEFEQIIREALAKTDGAELTNKDLCGLEELTLTDGSYTLTRVIDYAVNLKKFAAYDARITGSKAIGDLTKLEELVLSNIVYYAQIPFAELIHLKKLNLSNNSAATIEGLSALINLEVLDLSWNKLKKIDALSTMTALTSVNLESNQIADIHPLILNSENDGIGSDDTVNLNDNLLYYDSCDAIQTLENNGVEVLHNVICADAEGFEQLFGYDLNTIDIVAFSREYGIDLKEMLSENGMDPDLLTSESISFLAQMTIETLGDIAKSNKTPLGRDYLKSLIRISSLPKLVTLEQYLKDLGVNSDNFVDRLSLFTRVDFKALAEIQGLDTQNFSIETLTVLAEIYGFDIYDMDVERLEAMAAALSQMEPEEYPTDPNFIP